MGRTRTSPAPADSWHILEHDETDKRGRPDKQTGTSPIHPDRSWNSGWQVSWLAVLRSFAFPDRCDPVATFAVRRSKPLTVAGAAMV